GPGPNDPGAVLWEREWDAGWEVERIVQAVAALPVEALAAGRLMVFASEPPEIRRVLAERLSEDLRARGIEAAEVIALSAFKAGLSWLREVVTPALAALPVAPERVLIAYRRMTEDGTLDMPIRWLQELFPGPELMAADLGIEQGAIELVEAGDDAPATFVAEAFDGGGASLGRWTCTPPWRPAPFAAAFGDEPGRVVVTTGGAKPAGGQGRRRPAPFVAALGDEPGRVIVTTGGVMATDGDGWRELARVPTDLETFWEFWQGEVIPDLLRLVEQAGAWAAAQPFFGELLAEVWVSEPNERLGVREENDSAAEALAEDIYFTTLDAIELFGKRETEEALTAPGAIVPIVRVVPGAAPRARITLRAAPAHPTLPYPDLRISELRLDGDALQMTIEATVDGDPAPTLARLQQLATTGLAEAQESITARVVLDGGSVELRLPVTSPLPARPASRVPRPDMTTNLHGDTIIDLAESLAAAPEVTAWVEDWSYQGRPIPALALAAPCEGRLRSPVKAAILKPTYLVVARHHANEISSTNAAFQLAWLGANEPRWRRYLDAVNVVVLPYENPDGAALHARLASFPESGTWKHHPARYNALGFEYGFDHL
ncbi:MAG TPA: M14 family zinc carboxypeptidase, partial [Thermomicrobiales bacterium]|nr:M14 family zinc carboxypeptidase [Thermomicrobiales bacterium]